MATEEEAHLAREQHSDFLRESGAHAIAVDKIQHSEKETFGVIAFFEKQPSPAFPHSLEIEQDGHKKKVPLTTKIMSRAVLE